MSIVVNNLTRHYGAQKAVDALSFEVRSGQVVGLLGPNGAGKSTTMKMLTSYLKPDSGSAQVGGKDVVNESLEVRRILGYLPESNPLYTDMYVREYLLSVAAFYQMDRPHRRVEKMIEQTGLGPEAHKRIVQLSKGYRQRVGLAQALVHDPQVLILDEPTSGLDPNQLVGIRELIMGLAADKTVLLSTHILQEVEWMCPRVLIIHKGRLVADDTIQNLRSRVGQGGLEVEWDREPDWNRLAAVPGVRAIKRRTAQSCMLEAKEGVDLSASVFDWSVAEGLRVVRMEKPAAKDLESVFRELTAARPQTTLA
ncbi:MAG: ATP-binding cassette domain-containing protein [Bacteroidetes bacterium]|nr:ATP-binding cassette domain-containing protein [Bacteroidota bacterium]